MPPKSMTANPIQPSRHRPGKPRVEEQSSDDEESQDEVEATPSAPPPKATSFPADSTKIASSLRNVDLNERRAKAAAEETARLEAEKAARAIDEEGFVTASSSAESGSEEEGDEESSVEESSSDDEPRKLIRPTFIRKDQRKDPAAAAAAKSSAQIQAEEEARRKAQADELVQLQLERQAAARAAGKKNWDDDDEALDPADAVDDTDDLDPEAERAAWKLRELKRIKRDREAIEAAEAEREEIERRRNLTVEERAAEDREFLDKQKEEQEGRGKAGFMQRYFHKGAFFQDEAKENGLLDRDIMGARFEDAGDISTLPEYMQIRDMTKLGRKGRSKYKDLKAEDTGRWGDFGSRRGGGSFGGVDERFQPDRGGGGGPGASGANAMPVKERDSAPKNSPSGPRGDRYTAEKDGRERRRSYSPYDRERRRRRSYSRSASPPRRERRGESRERRKRSPSPYGDRNGDKRRRVDAA